MKVTIRHKFVDKNTKRIYRPGDVVEMTEARAAEITKALPKALYVPKAEEKPKETTAKKEKAE